MTERKTAGSLDFEALRYAIERCNPNLVLGFYADDALLSIANAEAQVSSPFELRGKAEIAKHLRTTFGSETSHRIEGVVVGEDLVTFREACEYPGGSLVLIETTLEVRDGNIVRQVDVVRVNSRPGSEEGIGRSPPSQNTHPETHLGVEAPQPDRLLRSKQATEKEDLR